MINDDVDAGENHAVKVNSNRSSPVGTQFKSNKFIEC